MFDSFPRVRGKGTLEAKQKVGMGAVVQGSPSPTLPRANGAQGRGQVLSRVYYISICF
jgi:hypothetical protein